MKQNYSAEINLENGIKIEIRVKLNGNIITFNEFKKAIQIKLDRATKARNLESPIIQNLEFTLTNQAGFFPIWSDEAVVDFNDEKLVSRIIINRSLDVKKEENMWKNWQFIWEKKYN